MVIMDAIVTARVPAEIKEQVNKLLHELGSSQSQLINLAYSYVLEHKALPGNENPGPSSPGKRKLSKQQLLELEESLKTTTFVVSDEFWQDKPYKELIAEGRKADYEALS